MTNRELLELAAKAAGYQYTNCGRYIIMDGIPENWNPLRDDGDAFRLAVKLRLQITVSPDETHVEGLNGSYAHEPHKYDPYVPTRRAIVRAAAEIGKGMR